MKENKRGCVKNNCVCRVEKTKVFFDYLDNYCKHYVRYVLLTFLEKIGLENNEKKF